MPHGNTARRRHGRLPAAFALFALCMAVVGSCGRPSQDDARSTKQGQAQPTGGETSQQSEFCRADSGTWLLVDQSVDVLKEPKQPANAADRERCLLRVVPGKGQLRIVATRDGWKQVEVLEQGAVAARGWVDGRQVSSARLIAKTDAVQPTLHDDQGRDLLGQIVPLTFKDDVTLENALQVFSLFGVKIEVDASVTPEMRQQKIKPVRYENRSFREALTSFCDQNALRFSVEGKQIVVRTK
jgi:hypothetical protein